MSVKKDISLSSFDFCLSKTEQKNQSEKSIDLKGEKVKKIFRQCFFLRNFLNNKGGEKEKNDDD